MAVSTPTRIPLLSTLSAACVLMVAPAVAAAASSGGAGLTGTAGSPGASSNPLVQPAYTPLTSSANGLTLETVSAVQATRRLLFAGSAPATDAGRMVEIEMTSGVGPDPQWSQITQAPVSRAGTFITAWRAATPGRFEVEAVLSASGSTQPTTTTGAAGAGAGAAEPADAASTPPVTISVYQPSVATLYGPGLYGQQTAAPRSRSCFGGGRSSCR
jgi:hypothetical protein